MSIEITVTGPVTVNNYDTPIVPPVSILKTFTQQFFVDVPADGVYPVQSYVQFNDAKRYISSIQNVRVVSGSCKVSLQVEDPPGPPSATPVAVNGIQGVDALVIGPNQGIADPPFEVLISQRISIVVSESVSPTKLEFTLILQNQIP